MEVANVISTTLLGVDSACSPERALPSAVMNSVMATTAEYAPALWGGAQRGVAITGVLPAQFQGTTVSGASLHGTGLVDASFDVIVTARVRKGVPAGTTTSSSPPV
jgi:hypothetical protein